VKAFVCARGSTGRFTCLRWFELQHRLIFASCSLSVKSVHLLLLIRWSRGMFALRRKSGNQRHRLHVEAN